MKSKLILAALIMVALVAGFRTVISSEASAPEEKEEEVVVVAEPENTDVLGSSLFEVATDNFNFTPDSFEASPGQTVTIKIANVSGVHDFVIEELDVHTDHVKETGDVVEVTFTVPEDASGDYEFYCGIGNHRELGMVGTLTITP